MKYLETILVKGTSTQNFSKVTYKATTQSVTCVATIFSVKVGSFTWFFFLLPSKLVLKVMNITNFFNITNIVVISNVYIIQIFKRDFNKFN